MSSQPPPPPPGSFVESLRQADVVSDEALDAAVREATASGRRLEEVLAERQPAAERAIYRMLAEFIGLPFDDLTRRARRADAAAKIPSSAAFARGVAPLSANDGTLTVAVSRLETLGRLDELTALTGLEVSAVLAPPRELQKFVRGLYGLGAETVERLVASTPGGEPAPAIQVLGAETHTIGDELDDAQQASITRFVDQMLHQAIREHASDIHLEPFEDELQVRFRVNGLLAPVPVPPTIKQLEAAIISRVKVMAGMDIAEKRLSQDGQMRIQAATGVIDLRVSILPTIYGESVVIRLLDPDTQLSDLEQTGMPESVLGVYKQLLEMAQGLILVTGPTGSGKTTTLNASLRYINRAERKILTVEDPVEYRLRGIGQVQVRQSIGLGFSTLLRNIVRHDPDVLMVGEIRDTETAQIAMNSAITGHLVLSTLHTNDAPTAVARLTNMGVPPYLICAALRAVVAQRLVRTLCRRCRRRVDQAPEAVVRRVPQLAGQPVYEAVGCDACHQSGYAGRTGIHEFFVVDEHINQMILDGASTDALRDAAVAAGMVRLQQAGLELVHAGATTLDEVYRVTRGVPQPGDTGGAA